MKKLLLAVLLVGITSGGAYFATTINKNGEESTINALSFDKPDVETAEISIIDPKSIPEIAEIETQNPQTNNNTDSNTPSQEEVKYMTTTEAWEYFSNIADSPNTALKYYQVYSNGNQDAFHADKEAFIERVNYLIERHYNWTGILLSQHYNTPNA